MNVTTNELIPIRDNDGKKAVNARDLHAFLGSKRDFSTWIKDRIDKYDFIENQDFQVFNKFGENLKGGRPAIEYALSISMAKELSMIENNERGKQARKYFISCEEKTTRQTAQLSRKELALMVIQAEEEKERLMLANEQQQATIDEQEKQLKSQAPKVKYVDNVLQSVNTYTATQIAKEVGMDAAKFHRALKERKVMFYQSGTWMLTAKYQGQGYTKMRTHQFTRNDGSIGTSSYTVFTERGRALMHSIFAK